MRRKMGMVDPASSDRLTTVDILGGRPWWPSLVAVLGGSPWCTSLMYV